MSLTKLRCTRYDPTNSASIDTFLDLLQHSESWDTCRWVANDLGEVCNDDHSVAETLLGLLSMTHERRIIDGITSGLQKVFQPEVLKIIVRKLKNFLNKEIRENNFLLYKSSFEILWHCASRLPYSEFYEIWHSWSLLLQQSFLGSKLINRLLNRILAEIPEERPKPSSAF